MSRPDSSARTLQFAPLNGKYLRAVHDFEQPSEPGEPFEIASTKCNLTAGDVVMVHLTNSQGWADGTILNTGRRGWLPASYCQSYDHENVRIFFHGLAKLWIFCNQESVPYAQRARIKEDTKPLVQGVRQALDSVHCLSRDDSLIKTVTSLAWTRKSLLSRLAALVKQSDKLAQHASNPMDDDSWSDATADVLQKAYEVAVGLVTFMDAWVQHTQVPYNTRVLPSPSETLSLRTPTESFRTPVDSHVFYELPSYDFPALTSDASPSVSQVSSNRTTDNVFPPRSTTPKPLPNGQTSASLFTRPSEADLQAAERADSSMRDFLGQLNAPNTPQLASVMLTNAQTDFFDNIRSFLKLYTQSEQSGDIDMVVSRTLGSSSTLMTAVHRIRLNNPNARQSFDESLKTFSQCLNNLSMSLPVAEETRDNQPSFINPASGAALISVATICIRAAAQCVAVARRSIEEHGDFDIGIRPDRGMQTQPKQTPPGPTQPVPTWPVPTQSAPTQPVHTRQSQVDTTPPGPETARVDENASTAQEDEGASAQLKPRSNLDEQADLPLSITIPDQPNKRSTIIKAETAAAVSPPSTSTESAVLRDSVLRDSMLRDSMLRDSMLRDSMLSNGSSASTAVISPIPGATTGKVEDGQAKLRTSPRIDSSGSKRASTPPDQIYTDELILGDKGRVLGGTPRALVEHLIHHTSAAALKLEETFFLTFKAFVSAEELAALLIAQYKRLTTLPGPTGQQRKRIFDLVKKWVTKFWDVELNREAKERLEAFANDHTVNMMPVLRQRLLETIRKADVTHQTLDVTTADSKPASGSSSSAGDDGQLGPPPEMTKVQISMLVSGAKGASVLDFSPLEIARQLTLLCSQAFCAVKPADLLSPSLNKAGSGPPTILALSRLSTDITHLATHTILSTEDAKKRVAVLRQWIVIAQECLTLQNYDTLMAIMCSLNSVAVSRLQKTWKELPAKALESFNELKNVCDVGRNFAQLRQRLMTTKLPCLPFIGIFLTDLTFVDAGNGPTRVLPSTKDSPNPVEVVNFDRYARTAAIVNVVQRFQLPYRLQEVAGLRDWLRREMEEARTEDDVSKNGTTNSKTRQQSLSVEPNGTAAANTAGAGDEDKAMLKDADQRKNVLLRKRLFEDKIFEADKTKAPSMKTISVSKAAADL